MKMYNMIALKVFMLVNWLHGKDRKTYHSIVGQCVICQHSNY